MAVAFYIPSAMCELFGFYSSSSACNIISFYFDHSDKYLRIAHSSLPYISLMANNIKHFSMCLFAICIFLVKCLVLSLPFFSDDTNTFIYFLLF